jgi:branched-chain amino acid transport system permease protein
VTATSTLPRLSGTAVFAIFGVVLFASSWFLAPYHLVLATRILILALFAMSLDLLDGYLGLTSLGHAVFLGTSAYVTGFIAIGYSDNIFLLLAAGLLTSAVLGAVIGLLILRATGVYFLMLSLAVSQVVWGIAWQWRSLTGGDDGLGGIPRPSLGEWIFVSSASYYRLTIILFLIAVGLLLRIVHSPFGLTLEGIRESTLRMQAFGYNVWLHKYIAFVLSSVVAGLAGVLLALQNGIVTPTQLSLHTSAIGLLMALVGGAGTIIGPIIGAFIVVLLEYGVSQYTERWVTILGLIYIAVVLGAPNGVYLPVKAAIAHQVRLGCGWWKGKQWPNLSRR